ncbi:Acireductone dioxygenase [Bacillus sp. THAF10]|uniref:1,2-dihydroxy-3-keto-5-methylthiopentene dioxygenase n=1 Tax=Bacillus sp. THAF10 TaxID=2587848 RepID=UPI001268D64D|nr:cupin domain-containing protein [Bacillus sp. THAF10]QFT88517.1 Acireductone dioxygenase [Bacillus sp. THAF10]
MAEIRVHNTGERISGKEQVEAFLSRNEVIYENWEIAKLPGHLQENFTLTDENKEEILEVFKEEIAAISLKRGYKSQDVISLSETTPNLEQLLKNFQQEHHHTDDEVRFIVSGHGIFIIQGKDGSFFDVELEPGDLISVPPNVRHYFTLMEDRKVVAIRIFVTTEGWVPIYEKEEVKN